MTPDEILKFINGLEVEETQPVSFSFMNNLGHAISQDSPLVNEIDEEERTIVPEDLIPFLP